MKLNLGNVVGPPGDDGFSPIISENKENTDEIYRLDIVTKEKSFTTPNLKGGGGDTGGLSFGQDNEGKWGYIPPGADTVTPFKTGSEGMETLIFTAPYDIAERYFTYRTFNGDTGLPETNEDWRYVYEMALPSGVIITKDFSVLSLTVKTG